MIHLQPNDRLFISEDVVGFADEINSQGTVPRRIDLMFLGFSYAITSELLPAKDVKRHTLIQVAAIEPNLLLATEAVAQWYTKEKGLEQISDEKQLLEFICFMGITGIRDLQKRWKNKSKSQIQRDILVMG
jgi:hypothetical protein